MKQVRKILALWEVLEGSKEPVRDAKVAYLHRSAVGGTSVDGVPARVILHRAGEPLPTQAERTFVIVYGPDDKLESNGFFAVNDGETLLRVGEDPGRDGLSIVNSGFVGVSSRYDLWRPIRAGVLTISDKGSAGERKDEAGPLLCDLIRALGADVLVTKIIPDDQAAIEELLINWADSERLNLILTTGGTGLSPRDVTPEAFAGVADKLVPGIGEAMRSKTAVFTEKSYLTRSVAVVRKDTLMIAFPGSKRAVRQCFEAVMPFLRHGLEILAGWDSECGGH